MQGEAQAGATALSPQQEESELLQSRESRECGLPLGGALKMGRHERASQRLASKLRLQMCLAHPMAVTPPDEQNSVPKQASRSYCYSNQNLFSDVLQAL